MIFEYKMVKESNEVSVNVNRSVFIGNIFSVVSMKDVRFIIDKVRKKNVRASHVAWAVILLEGVELREFSSDDGEPHHTAGDPILRILKKYDLKNTLITVSRIFGGKKLGVRGLIDAYKGCAEKLVINSEILDIKVKDIIKIPFEYEHFGELLYVIEKFEGVVLERDFGKMELSIEIPLKFKKDFLKKIYNL